MVATLVLAGLAARLGLRLRAGRRARRRRDPALRPRHVRLGKVAVALLVPGFALGLASAVWLRGMTPLSTAHGWIASGALVLFGAVAALGLRLERRGARPVLFDLHGALALAALLAAAAAFFTGFVLLP
jgi:hypothetical protein